jgi:hypothetical protein
MKKLIIIFLLLLTFSGSTFAKEESPSPSLSPSPSPTPVQYVLPYPGLLPGSPLYPIKAARDKIIETFITDALKKADFYILQADKRLNAGILLYQQGKFELSEETISKGENYLEMAIGRTRAAKEQNESVDERITRLHLSSLKHQEVIKMLIKEATGDVKKGLENDLKRAERIDKEVETLKPKK